MECMQVHAWFALRSGPRTDKVPASLPRIRLLDEPLPRGSNTAILRSCHHLQRRPDYGLYSMSSMVIIFGWLRMVNHL